MPFACDQFLEVARTLCADGAEDQARLRTAAGRAYYAVYGLIRSGIAERGGGWPAESTKPYHAEVISALRNSQKSELKEICECLKQLHLLRVQADYRYHDPIAPRQVIANIEIGSRAVALIDRLTKADFSRLRRSLFG